MTACSSESPGRSCRWILAAFLGALASVPGGLAAEEPTRLFLQKLRAEGYFEIALEYLDRQAANPAAPADFRAVLDYERAVTLIQSAGRQRDLVAREKLLDQAQGNLEKFLQEQGGHYLVAAARRQAGNVLVERARIKIAQSKKGEPAPRLQEAASLFDQAAAIFTGSRDEIRQQLEQLKDESALDPKQLQRRDELRQEYLEAQLLMALVLEEKADTAPATSPQRSELLQNAAEQYKQFFEKYRRMLAGLYARLYEGRCQQKLGNFEAALTIYVSDLLEQPNEPDQFRELKTKTLLQSLECWLDDSQKKYAEAITRGSAWLDQIRPNENSEADWLLLRLQLARAHQRYAAELQTKSPGERQIRDSIDQANKLARFVARFPGDLKTPAQELLALLPGGMDRAAERPAPKTYDEARAAAREAFNEMQSAEFALANLPERLAKETDASVKQELQKSLDEAQQTLAASRAQARENFELALRFADAETPPEDVNQMRYSLAYLAYQAGDFYDAAVLADFVARRYPADAAARPCARITMSAFLRLYGDSTSDDKSFERRHALEATEYLVRTWKGQPEALEALNVLVPFLVQEGDLSQAEETLADLPPDSADRGLNELRIGQAYWSKYLQGSRQVSEWQQALTEEGADTAALTAQLAALQPQLEPQREKARSLLVQGAQRITSPEAVTETVVAALLSLAQLYVETNQPADAWALLEKESTGLLPLLAEKHPAFARPLLVEETYRTGLRALIGSLPAAKDPADTARLLAKAKELMESLRAAMGQDEEGQKKLINNYYRMARDLQSQIAVKTNPQDKLLLAQGFTAFLDEVSREAKDLSLLNWVAESYVNLGTSLAASPDSAKDARPFFGKAAEGYERILALAQTDPEALTPQLAAVVRLRAAAAARQLGDFEKSLTLLEQSLRENPMNVDVQVEAARTYQQWATDAGKVDYYDKAVKGDVPDKVKGGNLIWGWIKISRMTQRYPKLQETFHEARYNLALSHLLAARRKKDSGERTKYLNYAKNDILNTQMVVPQMGGDKWRAKYDALLRDIQKELKQTPVGLQPLPSGGSASETKSGSP